MALSGAHAGSCAGAHGRRAAGCRARGRAAEHLQGSTLKDGIIGIRRAEPSAWPASITVQVRAPAAPAAPPAAAARHPGAPAAGPRRSVVLPQRPGRRGSPCGREGGRWSAGSVLFAQGASASTVWRACAGFDRAAGCREPAASARGRGPTHCHLTSAAWALLPPWWPPGGARPHLREQPGEEGQWGSLGSGASRTTASRAAPFASQLAAAGAARHGGRSGVRCDGGGAPHGRPGAAAQPVLSAKLRQRCCAAVRLAVPRPPLPMRSRTNVGSPAGACTRPAAAAAAAAAQACPRLAAALPRPTGRLPGRLHHRPVPVGVGGDAQLAAEAVQVRGGDGAVPPLPCNRRCRWRFGWGLTSVLVDSVPVQTARLIPLPCHPHCLAIPAGRARRTRTPRARMQRASRCWRSTARWWMWRPAATAAAARPARPRLLTPASPATRGPPPPSTAASCWRTRRCWPAARRCVQLWSLGPSWHGSTWPTAPASSRRAPRCEPLVALAGSAAACCWRGGQYPCGLISTRLLSLEEQAPGVVPAARCTNCMQRQGHVLLHLTPTTSRPASLHPHVSCCAHASSTACVVAGGAVCCVYCCFHARVASPRGPDLLALPVPHLMHCTEPTSCSACSARLLR